MFTRQRLLSSVLAVALLYVTAHIASAAELQLAGIRLGRSAMTIIQKFGNPTEIRVGMVAQDQQSPNAPMPSPMMGGMPGMEGMPGALPGQMPSDMMGAPGAPMPGAPTVTKKRAPELTWIYRFPKNKTLEFIVSPDGRVMQIAAYAAEWPNVRTSKGITFGSTYKDLLAKYGFPESHQQVNIQLIARYSDKQRAIFVMVAQTVVGITIGLMD